MTKFNFYRLNFGSYVLVWLEKTYICINISKREKYGYGLLSPIEIKPVVFLMKITFSITCLKLLSLKLSKKIDLTLK